MTNRGHIGKKLIGTALAALAALLFGTTPTVRAFTNVWNGTTGGSWTGTTWTNGAYNAGATNRLTNATMTVNLNTSTNTAGILLSGTAGTITITNSANTLTITTGYGINVATNATFNLNVGTVTLGAAQTWTVTNNATLFVGAIVNNNGNPLTFNNAGTATLTNIVLGTGGLTKNNVGILTLSGTAANTYSGPTTNNAGELDLNKSAGVNAIAANLTVAGGTVKLLANEQIADTAVVTINGGSFNLNGANETVASTIIGASGLLTNGIAGATLSGGLTNAGTVFVSADTFFTGPVTNTSVIYFQGAISNALVNRGSFNLNNNATITVAPVNTGTLDANGKTLTVTPTWTNSGTILLGGGSLAGGTLTNNAGATVAEFGAISNAVVNSGNIVATNGELRLANVASGAGAYKAAAGASTATLTFAGGGSISALFNTNTTVRLESVLTNTSIFVNQGTLALDGGTYYSTANLTNAAGKVVSGSGTISARLVNLSTAILEATNGTLTLLQAPVMHGIVQARNDGTLQFGDDGNLLVITNATTGSIRLYGGTLSFSALTNFGDIAAYDGGGTFKGVVINASNGSIDATNGTLVFLNDLVNAGLVTNSATLQIGSTGAGAITNAGTMVLAGGSFNAGVITNTGTLLGSGVIDPRVFNSGLVGATNGELQLNGVASGAGVYRAVAGTSASTLTFAGGGSISALFNTNATIRLENVLTNTSVFVNQGTIALAGGTYFSAQNLTNAAGEVIIGSGTISVQRLVNLSTAILEATNGTLTLLQTPVMQGIVNVRSDGTLQFGDTGSPLVVTNGAGGSIRMYGGTISFGTLTNSGNIAAYNGGGTLTGLVINAASGSIDATNGTLVFLNDLTNLGLLTNKTTVQVGSTGAGAITNAGTMVLAGGSFNAAVITNTGTLLGFGAVDPRVINSGLVGATNGELQLNGVASGAGVYRAVAGASASTLTFAGGGSISALLNTGATIRVESGALTNTASFVNRGTLTLADGTYQSSASVINSNTFKIENAAGTTGTLNAQLVNAGTLAANTGTLTLLVAPTQTGAVTIAAGGVLNVVPDWANSGAGTITFTAGGAITGGTLTNTSSSVSAITGAGFINSFLVNQNRLDLNGTTVSNDFLQTAGSFTLGASGGTITGTATINGGTNNLLGNRLTTGLLVIGPNGVLTNSTANTATLVGGVTNAGTVNFANDVYVLGLVTNTGTWIQRGAISNNVVNAGTMTLQTNTINPRVTGGLVNSGSLIFNGAGFVSGPVTNSGSISFNGAISNNYVQTAGSITLNNPATITQTASITGGSFNLNGKTYSNGLMVVSDTGVLTNNVAGASFSGGLSNDNVVAVTADTFFKGPVTNTGAFFMQGAISNTLVNSGSFNLNGNSTLTFAPVNTGTIDADGKTLTVNPAWANSGTVLLTSGTVAGGNLTNNSGATVSGAGTIAPLLVNNGLLVATNGTLTLSVAPQQKGVVNVADGAAPGTLTVTPAWSNSGTVNIAASATVSGGTLTNLASGTVTNFGSVSTLLVNQGRVVLGGLISNLQQTSGTNTVSGSGSVTGTATISGGLFDLNGGTYSNGLMILSGTGVLTNGMAGATFNGGLSNNATVAVTADTFFNGPVTNTGTFRWQGAISNNYVQTAGTTLLNDNATITQNATINGGAFNLNGQTYSNRQMTVAGTGVLTNAGGVATFNGGLSNNATVAVTANTFFNGPVTNTGAFFFQGAISNNALVNRGSFNLNDDATLTVAPVNSGTINVAASTLTVVPAWANAGSLQIAGGVLAGGAVTNLANESFSGFGTVSNLVVNNGTLTATNGTLTFVLAPANNGTALVANASVLNVLPAWTNVGVLSNATTGAVSGGTLTNTGTINGLGFFNPLVVNQNRLNFGGTISNDFLQTAGSFTVNGSATITATATINGGTLDLAGNRLTVDTVVIAPGATLTNGVQNATLNGGITNAGTVNSFRDLYVNGPVTNTGTWIQRGAISNSVYNAGTMTLFTNGVNFRITGGIVNTGSLTFDTSGIVYVSGIVSNSGSFAFGDVISNNLVNIAGSILLVNNGTVTGNTLVNGGTFNLNGKNFTNAQMIVSGTGVLSNAVANSSFSGGLSNDAIVAVTADTFFKGAVTNTGSFFFRGAISNALVNSGNIMLNGNSTITGSATISDGLVNFNGKNGTLGSLNGGGGTLLNNGNGTSVLTVNSGGSYSGTIADNTVGSGTMALTVAGGVLTLSGNNTYSGVTTVTNSGATLKLGSATALGSTAGNTVVSNGVLDLNGQTVGAEKLELKGTGIANGGALINSSGTAASLAGNINDIASDAGAYSVGGTGDITLSGNVQGKLTKVSGNTLTLGGTVDNVGLGLTVSNGVVVLAKTSNGGVHALGGAGFTLAGGTIQLGGTGGDQIYDFSFITINSGTFDFNGRSETMSAVAGSGGTILNNGGGDSTINLGVGTGSQIYSGVIADHTIGSGTMALVKSGTSTQTLSGVNSYSGGTTVSNGMLRLGNASALGTGGLTMSGGTLNLNQFSVAVANLSGSGGTILANNGIGAATYTLTVGSDNTSTAYGGVIANNTDGLGEIVALTKTGAGVLTLSGINTYSGNTIIQSGGAINIQSANALGSTAAGTTVNTGGALQIQGGITTAAEALTLNGTGMSNDGALRNISGNNTFSGGITLGSATRINSDLGTLTISAFTAGGNFALTIGGAGNTLITAALPATVNSLTKDGNGTLILSNAANAYVGATVISAGTLKLALSNVLPDGAGKGDVTVNDTLDMAGFSDTINGLSGNGTVDNTTGTGNTLTVGNNNATSVFSGTITNSSGTLALTKTGTGVLTLGGTNGYGGATTVSQGIVKLGSSGALPSSSAVSVSSGGTLDLNGQAATVRSLTISTGAGMTNGIAGASLNNGLTNAGTVFVSQATYLNGPVTNTGAMFFIGAISNNLVNRGSFTLNDDSTLTAAPVNTGTINAGANTLTVNPAWANAGTVLVNGGVLAGGNLTNSANLAGFGSLNTLLINQGLLTVSNGTLTLATVPILQSGGVSIAPSGILNITPDWSSGGGTIAIAAGGAITGGTLTNTTGTLSGSGFVKTFLVNQGRMDFGGTVSNNFLQTAGSFTLSGNATITGNATISGGTLDLLGNRLTDGLLVIGTGATLTNGVQNATVTSGITNAGTVNMAADLYVLGAVTNTGFWLQRGAISNNVVNSGTMFLLSNSIAARVTGGIVNSGSLTFTNSFASGPVTNSGSFSFSGAISNNYVQTAGSITLNNTATITGTASINAGTFDLNGKNFTNAQMIVSGTGVLTNAVAGASFSGGLSNANVLATTANTFFKGPVTNTGAMFFQGTISNSLASSGTVTLNGDSVVTGTALINGGSLNLNGMDIGGGQVVVGAGGLLTNGVTGGSVSAGLTNAGTVFVSQNTFFNGAVTNTGNLFFQGAISNNLVSSGSVLLNNNATITGTATINGGVFDLNGKTYSNGLMTVTGSGTLTNGIAGATFNGGLSNAATVVVTADTFFNKAVVTNSGTFVFQGAISNSFVQTAGTFTLGNNATITGTATVTGGQFNLNGKTYTNNQMVVAGTGVLTNAVAGATFNGGLSNAATVVVTADTFFNGPVTNSGAFRWQGAISNNYVQSAGTNTLNGTATITQSATIGGGLFNLNGQTYSNRQMIVSGTGILTNAVAGATFNGGLSNAATVAVTADTFFNGPVTNMSAMFFQGAISNNTLVNRGSFNLNDDATLTVAPVNSGTINVAASTLTVVPAWANGGSLQIGGGVLAGGNLTNTISLAGFGSVNTLLINQGLLTVSNGTLTLATVPILQSGGVSIAPSGILNITPDWSSGGGTIAIAAGGAITGGTLTNTTGTLSGSGFVKTFLVNQGRMDFGGTVSNNFLQTAGSFTLSGDATVTGSATINGGTLNLSGSDLRPGLLVVSGTGVLTNGVAGSTVNGGVSNASVIAVTADTFFNGPVTNTGAMFFRGAISNSLVNSGSVTLNSTATVTGNTMINAGTLNLNGQRMTNGLLVVTGTGVLTNATTGATVSGGISNANVIAVTADTFFNGPVTNTGAMFFRGAISNNLVNAGAGVVTLNNATTITGSTTINNGSFNLNGQNFSNRTMIVGSLGLLTNGTAGASFSGGLTNAGTVFVSADTFFKGPITNTANFFFRGAISNQLVNSGSFMLNANGTITTAPINTGTIDPAGRTLTVTPAWANSGTIILNNGTIAGGNLTDNSGGFIRGNGTITAAVTINSGGHIAPGNSVGTINVATLTLASGSVLDFEFNNTPANDLINVLNSGGLTLNGGNFNLYQENTLTPWGTLGTYNLIGYSGTLNGSPGNLSVLNPASGNVYLFGANGSFVTLTVAIGQSWTGSSPTDNNWSSTANWSTGVPQAGDVLVFDGTSRINNTNNLAANTQFSGIVFNGGAGSFTNNGNAVNLIGDVVNNSANTQTIKLPLVLDGGDRTFNAASATLVVSGVISDANGSWGITKTGAGTITLSGANTYSGDTTISAGILKLGAANVLPDGTGKGNVVVNGTLDLGGFSETINGLSGAGTVDNTTGSSTYTLTVGNNDQSSTFSGVIQDTSGTLALTKIGTGLLTLSGSAGNANSGLTTVSAGELDLSKTSGNAVSGNLTINSGATVKWINANQVSDTAAVTVNGTGLLNLNGKTDTIGNLSGDGSVNLGSGALMTGDGNSTTFSGVISGTGSLTKQGSGAFTLSGSNTYSGVTLVNSGTLKLGHTNALGSPAAGVTVSSGGSLDLNGLTIGTQGVTLNGGALINGSGTDASLAGGITLASDSSLGGAGNMTLSGVISGGNGLTKVGAGTVAIAATNSYSGGTTINAGVLSVNYLANGGANSALGSSSSSAGNLTINGGTLRYTGGAVSINRLFTLGDNDGTIDASGSGALTLNNTGNITVPTTFLGAQTLTLTGTNTEANTLASSLNNGVIIITLSTSSLTKSGAGTWVISGNNGYSGATTINGGVLRLNNASALGGGSLTINGGVLEFQNPTSFTRALGTGSGQVQITGGVSGFSAFGSPASVNLGGAAGEVTWGSSTFNPTALVLNESTATAKLTFQNGINLNGATRTINVNANTAEIANVIRTSTGTAGLIKGGSGTLILSAANTYNGDTTIGTGTLKMGIANALASGSGKGNVIVTGTLDVGGFNTTINGLTGGGVVNNSGVSAATLSVGNNDQTANFSGIIQNSAGALAVTKAGTGIITLSGTSANTYTGLTTVNAGELDLNKTTGNAVGGSLTVAAGTVKLLANDQIADGAVVTVNGGSFNLNGAKETVASTIIGSAGLFTNGIAGATLGGGVSNNGTVFLSADTFFNGPVTNTGNFFFLGAVSNTLANSGNVILNGSATITGVLANNGSVNINTGTLSLLAAPVQNGRVNVAGAGTFNVLPAWLNNGVVGLQNGSLIGGTVTNAGTIIGFGTITPQVRNQVGGTLTANGGTLTLTVAPNQLGNVVISNTGTLNVQQAWQNSGEVKLFGGTAIGSTITNASNVTGFGTITPQLLNNTGATLTASGGTLTLAAAPNQAGTFIVASGGTLNVQQDWQNSGLLSMVGGTTIGSTITNASNVTGFGTITPKLVNNAGATLTASGGTLTLGTAPVQNGTVVATNGGTLNVLQAWQNSGTVSFLGGTIIGSTITNAGTITGFGEAQSVVNNARINVTNGTWRVTSALAQNGTLDVAGDSKLDVTPVWANAGALLLNGGTTAGGTMTNTATAQLRGFGTVSNKVVNLGSVVATNGTLNFINAPTQSGTITVADAATLNSAEAWRNAGSVNLQGGTVIGSTLTNAGAIGGSGTITSAVINNSGATLTASGGGTLTLTAAPLQNGTVNILGTLSVASAWSNGISGAVNLNGGVLTGGTFTVDGTVAGNGTIAANMIVSNSKTVTVSGGTMNLAALTTMDGGVVTGGPVVNYGTISGFGTLNDPVSNPGFIRATNGLLYVQTLMGNQATGTLEASLGGTLQANGITPWLNNGQVILSGGTVIGADISNSISRTIGGVGSVNANIYNSGTIFANTAGQALNLNGSFLVNQTNGNIATSTGNLVVEGAFINSGTLNMVHSYGTFNGTVVNSGAWITDPTTNVFNNTYTVTASGYFQSSPGDLFIFTNSASTAGNFVNISTNKTHYDTRQASFLFDSTLAITQNFFTAAHDNGPAGIDPTATVEGDFDTFAAHNFALGTLSISAFSTVQVWDAFSNLGPGTNDDLRAALYVENLYLGDDSLLIISSNVSVYFVNSNSWSSLNFMLLGSGELHQFINQNMISVIPEPGVVFLWLSGLITVYAARRRRPRKH